MNKKLNILLFVLMSSILYSQQVVMFNHYFYKPMSYNPAFTGTSDAPNLMLINHTQWTGFKGGPQYNILTFDGNVINKKGVWMSPPPPTTASIKPAVKAESANKMMVIKPYSLYKLSILIKFEYTIYN